jgi:hypothetical protein
MSRPEELMSRTELLSALVTFVLGLFSKGVYDFWVERRKRKRLLFTKNIKSSFSVDKLESSLRDQTKILFEGEPVNSVHVIEVEVENDGASVVRNQTFTVRFAQSARIVSSQLSGSEEDTRFIEEGTTQEPNHHRYLLNALRKGKTAKCTLIVINHDREDFDLEHGVGAGKDVSEADFEVTGRTRSDRVQLDVAGRLRRVACMIVLLQLGQFFRASQPILDPLVLEAFSILLLILYLLLLREVYRAIVPLMAWIKDAKKASAGNFVSIGQATSSAFSFSSAVEGTCSSSAAIESSPDRENAGEAESDL